ncbi:MAG: NifU family protein [Chloroflexota bacterium]|nr:NifU family protein [Chloroflexota bacterium]
MEDTDARDRVAKVETLLEEVEAIADPVVQEKATEVAQALLDLYGEGLARLVAHVAEHDDDGAIAQAVTEDDLVAHLLLLHGLHPIPLETRVDEALEGVRPYLDSHGGDVELLGVADGVVRLRMQGSCSGCPSSAVTLKLAIEEAIYKVAPDVMGIEAEGALEPASQPGLVELPMAGSPAKEPDLIELQVVGARPKDPAQQLAPKGSWTSAGGMPELADGGPLVKDVAGEALLFVRLDESVYAYRPQCPGCGKSLGDGALSGVELACPECGGRYDVRRAGRSLDHPERHLAPVPLLVDDGGQVRVAVPSRG